jgi:hypothetical protein
VVAEGAVEVAAAARQLQPVAAEKAAVPQPGAAVVLPPVALPRATAMTAAEPLAASRRA